MTTVNLNERSTYYASEDLISRLKENLKEGDLVLNFAYTDYGGTFFDKVCIAFFSENYPENIVKENTGWSGENAFLFGEVAKEFAEVTENYLLGFDGIEEFYYQMESEERDNGIEYFKSGIDADKYEIAEEMPDEFQEWVSGHCNVLTSGLDYCETDMINKAIETGWIKEIIES